MMNPLAGLYVNDEGEIGASVLKQDTWIPQLAAVNALMYDNKVPPAFQYTPYSKLTVAQQQLANKFYTALSEKTGKDVPDLFKNRHYAIPNANWSDALGAALQATTNLDIYQAFGLANYAGGAVLRKGLTGLGPIRPADGVIDFLDVGRLYSDGTKQVVSIEKALLQLKKNNPGAQEYVVNLIAAKAGQRAAQSAIVLRKDTEKVIKKELEIVGDVAKKGAEVATGAAKGLGDTLSFAAWLAEHWPYILGGTALLVAYLAYRNRDTITSAAKAYYTGGLLK